MSYHEFGGDWTTDKLERLRKYLHAYMQIFSKNQQARRLTPIYIDAFAGTGYRSLPQNAPEAAIPLPELAEPDNQAFLKGSARIALEVQPAFHRYIFIEQDAHRVQELAHLRDGFPQLAPRIGIVNQDANTYLMDWCECMGPLDRAVIFLDPYGMQVEWQLIEVIAKTQKIDLWLLFPLGVAVSRLLTRAGPPPEGWANALTRLLGTEKWREAFYPSRKVLTLFGEREETTREADFEKISQFFVQRLQTIFIAVAENPLPLRNSKNNPLYLLCFAAGNPRGAKTAVKIAQNILGK
jgi:three-Cys-motif partner protein